MDHFIARPPESAARLAYAGIAVRGRDARAFLQGQLTQDLDRLGPEALLRSAVNTAQGRVVALPWVIEREGAMVLVLPAELAAPVAGRLQRYVLRAKVEIATLAQEFLAFEALAPAVREPAAPATRPLAAGVSLLEFSNRSLLAGPAAALAAALPERARVTADGWRLAAIRAGEPDLDLRGTEHWIAQMLNVDLTDGVSFAKGCYTGQEIVARTQHLGRIKRRLFRYRGAGATPPAVLEALALAGEKVGEVAAAARDAEGFELLAVVALDARDRPLALACGAALEPLPLPYSVP